MTHYAKTWMMGVLLFVLFSSGCTGRKAIVKDTFLLNVDRPKTSAVEGVEGILAVQPFSVAPAFGGRGLVYRIGDNQYESDYYHEYVVSPAAMVTEQTRNWLSASDIFDQVLPPLSSITPTQILQGHIRKMAVDLRDAAAPKAVLQISFFLLEQNRRTQTIRFRKTYSASRPLESKTAAASVSALNQCLTGILENFEKDLKSHLAEK